MSSRKNKKTNKRAKSPQNRTKADTGPFAWFGRNALFSILGILLFTALCYAPSIGNDFVNWDDPRYVYDNPVFLYDQALSQFLTQPYFLNYHPLNMFSLAADYKISGGKASHFHAVNLLLHLFNTFLVFVFIALLTRKKWWIAGFVALFFAIHPMHVESVAWVSARKDVLFTFFYLLACIAYLRYLDTAKIKALLWCALAFLLSLLSKPAAVTLPVILLLLDYWRNRGFDKRAVLEKLPFFALSVLFGIITVIIQSEKAINEFDTFTILQRTAFASYGFVMYIVKLLVPFKLSGFYPYPFLHTLTTLPPIFWVMPFVALGLAAATIWAFIRNKRFFVFGMLFFLVNMALVMQFVSVGAALMAERYTYLPYVGLLFIIGWGWQRTAAASNPKLNQLFKPLGVLFLGVALVFGYITFERCKVWKDGVVFWSDVIEKYPERVEVAYKNRGRLLAERNQLDAAFKDYLVLEKMGSKDSKTYSNMGNVYGLRGELDKAIATYEKALNFDDENFDAYVNRGITYARQKRYAEALADLEKAVQLKPDDVKGLLNRASIKMEAGQYQQALEEFNGLAQKFPNPDVFFKRGFSLYKLGQTDKAIADYNKAIQLNPNYAAAYFNLSVLYSEAGDRQKALDFALKAKGKGYNVSESYLQNLR